MKPIITAFSLSLLLLGTAWAQPSAAPSATPAATKAGQPPAAKPATAAVGQPAAAKPAKETNCSDHIDNDNDSLVDCLDADCYDSPACKSSGGLENTDAYCSDGIDNDKDGHTDCEDHDCQGAAVTVCKGSWKGPLNGTGTAASAAAAAKGPAGLPTLKPGMTVEDLVGRGIDRDGERNDQVCSDGIDNDGDGMIDCQDFGCRFDPSVSVCRGTGAGIHFGVVAAATQTYDFEKSSGQKWDTQISKIQLRALGEIPGIQNSFFLLSVRAEKMVRLTFAMFEVPLYKGHRLNINSGGGGLSNGLVLSAHKNPLLEPAYYLNAAFEGGNGASLEVNGPIFQGLLDYRLFVSGGAGQFNGNVGGRYFKFDEFNYSWAVGGQLAFYPIGRFDRWDTRFLYTEVPLAVSFYAGARYDQRATERFPAANVAVMARWWRFLAILEGYGKRELEFKSWQVAYNAMFVALLIPKWLAIAADFGQYYATDFTLPQNLIDTDNLQRQTDELMGRVALHFYFYKNIGLLSAMFRHRFVENFDRKGVDRKETELIFEAQYRF